MFFQPRKSPSLPPPPPARLAGAPSGRRLGEGGFTLIELLAVLAIVAILTSIVLGAGRRASEAGKVARAKAELAALSAALESYKRQYGDYPQTDENAQLLQALVGKLGPTRLALNPAGRALIETVKFSTALSSAPDVPVDPFANSTAVLVDPWSQPYRYAYKSQAPWTNPSFVLYSIGPDGADVATLIAGGFADIAASANADNLHANRN